MPSNDESEFDKLYDPDDVHVLQEVLILLKRLPRESQKRVIQAVLSFLSFGDLASEARQPVTQRVPTYSEDLSPTPKQFLLEKKPASNVERVACLAYYLTHYRDTPHFKTLDLSKLNTEAAQPKFTNAAFVANDALKQRYLVQAGKGQKQLSALGEQFVNALPDREAARAIMRATAPRRIKRKARSTVPFSNGD